VEDRRVFVIVNAQSGAGHAHLVHKRFLEWSRLGLEVTVHESEPGQDLAREALRAVEDGHELIVAAGGDGTVAAAAAAVRGSDAVLGIVPLGTGNIVARDLSVPLDPEGAVDLLFEEHVVRRIDALEVAGSVYLMSLGVGISAYVARDTAAIHKRIFGPAAYLWSGLGEIGSVEPSAFEITVDGVHTAFSATEVAVANSGVFANMMLPWERNVRLDDGRMDVFVVATETARDYPILVFNVLRGSNSAEPGVIHLEARESVRIECEDAVPVQADGDVIGETPVDIRLLVGAVPVIVPPGD
jgi:YegS/Rv2252/BmrU family lipid kinase